MRRYTICWTQRECDEAEIFLSRCQLIASDVETIPYRKVKRRVGETVKEYESRAKVFIMTLVSYSGILPDGTIRSFAFPLVRWKSVFADLPDNIESILRSIRRINSYDIRFTGHNFVYDATWFIRYRIPVKNWAYDSMVLWWARYPDLPKTLDFVSSILLDDHQYWKQGRKETDFIQYCLYGMRDTESTLRNTIILIQWMLKDEAMRLNYFYAFTRCATGLDMSLKGMALNPDRIYQFEEELKKKTEDALDRLRFIIADPNFNPNSAPQKKALIYGLLGAQPRNARGRFAKTADKASTGAIPLRIIKTQHTVFRRIITALQEAQEPAKQTSNIINMVHYHRFRTGYDGVGTTTTRYSSRADPFGFSGNAQNIRKTYRKILKADVDSILMEVDYSAADDIFVSYESEEEKKIAVIQTGKDTHSYNCSEVFFTNWTYDSVVAGKNSDPPDPRVVHPITGIRQITKKVTHGCNYLMAGITLLMTAGREAIVAAAKEHGYADAGLWNQDQLVRFCTTLESAYRAYYPRFSRTGPNSFYTDLLKELKSTGGFTTIFRYKQRFLGDPREDSTIRAVAATAGQANTAGRINMAMDELEHGLRMARFRDGPAPDIADNTYRISQVLNGVDIRLQTHDSLTVNIKYTNPNWRDGVDAVLHVMSRPVLCKSHTFSVGIEADAAFEWAGKGVRVKSSVDLVKYFDDVGVKYAT
jgi:hypothetical protein